MDINQKITWVNFSCKKLLLILGEFFWQNLKKKLWSTLFSVIFELLKRLTLKKIKFSCNLKFNK